MAKRSSSSEESVDISGLEKEIAALKKEIQTLKAELRKAPKGGADPRVDKIIEAIEKFGGRLAKSLDV